MEQVRFGIGLKRVNSGRRLVQNKLYEKFCFMYISRNYRTWILCLFLGVTMNLLVRQILGHET